MCEMIIYLRFINEEWIIDLFQGCITGENIPDGSFRVSWTNNKADKYGLLLFLYWVYFIIS